MEMVAADAGAVAVEVHADLVPRAALRAAALIRERRQRRDVLGLRLHADLYVPLAGTTNEISLEA